MVTAVDNRVLADVDVGGEAGRALDGTTRQVQRVGRDADSILVPISGATS